jgi:type VI secretion system protein ImpG
MPSSREREGRRRSSYAGSELFLSLVDSANVPYRSDLRELAVTALCTNRDLPLMMPVGKGQTDFTLEQNTQVVSTRCVAGPTRPVASFAEGEIAWRAISHLSLNYLSIVDPAQGEKGAALRALLKLYGDATDPQIRKQIEGVIAASSRPVMRRIHTGGPIAFVRGLEVTITLDEENFEGTGVFLLGAVLERFLAKHVTINAFTETVVRSKERGEIMRWPARLGARHLI